MRYNKFDLNLLIALKALLKEKNVTRAGESIHVTQSAMSGILGRLRDYFNDPLIVPMGRRMELTPLAESLVGPVNDVLLRINATIATQPAFNPAGSRRHFTIVASDYSISVLMLEVLRRLHREAPGLTLEFRPPDDMSTADLEGGDVDFIIGPKGFALPSQCEQVLFGDSYTVVVARDHPDIGDTITLEQYVECGHVGYQASRTALPQFEVWFAQQYGDIRRVEVVAPSFQLLPQMVVATARVATMHARLAQLATAGLAVRQVRPLFDVPQLVEVLQWHHYRDPDPGSLWLRDCILETAQTLLPA